MKEIWSTTESHRTVYGLKVFAEVTSEAQDILLKGIGRCKEGHVLSGQSTCRHNQSCQHAGTTCPVSMQAQSPVSV